jgi:uncharacterized protein with HEPN domain
LNREIAKRLHDALSAGREIQEYAASTTREQFLEDRTLQLIFERLFEIVGEATFKAEAADPSLRDKLPDVGDIIGMRNRIAHGYSEVSYPVLWDTAVDKVPGMCANIERLLEDEPIE